MKRENKFQDPLNTGDLDFQQSNALALLHYGFKYVCYCVLCLEKTL